MAFKDRVAPPPREARLPAQSTRRPVQKSIETTCRSPICVAQRDVGLTSEAAGEIGLSRGGQLFQTGEQDVSEARGDRRIDGRNLLAEAGVRAHQSSPSSIPKCAFAAGAIICGDQLGS